MAFSSFLNQYKFTHFSGPPIVGKWNNWDLRSTSGSVQDKRTVFLKELAQLTARIDLMLTLPYAHFQRDIVEQKLNGFDMLCKDRQ